MSLMTVSKGPYAPLLLCVCVCVWLWVSSGMEKYFNSLCRREWIFFFENTPKPGNCGFSKTNCSVESEPPHWAPTLTLGAWHGSEA